MEFEPVSDRGEQIAKELLHEYGTKLLNKDVTPFEFCRLVVVFDASFMRMRSLKDSSIEYPEWLGDLWNRCNGCKKSQRLKDSSHLVEEVKRIMKKN